MAEVTERRLVQQFPLYYDLYVPEGEKPKPLIIALHGYDVELALRPRKPPTRVMQRPSASVMRYDRFDRVIKPPPAVAPSAKRAGSKYLEIDRLNDT